MRLQISACLCALPDKLLNIVESPSVRKELLSRHHATFHVWYAMTRRISSCTIKSSSCHLDIRALTFAHSTRILSLNSSSISTSVWLGSVARCTSQIQDGSYRLLVVDISLGSFPGPQISGSLSSFKRLDHGPSGSRTRKACHATRYFSAAHFVLLSKRLYNSIICVFGLFPVPETLSRLNCHNPCMTRR
jgi:hypothetical protein